MEENWKKFMSFNKTFGKTPTMKEAYESGYCTGFNAGCSYTEKQAAKDIQELPDELIAEPHKGKFMDELLGPSMVAVGLFALFLLIHWAFNL